MPRTKDITGNRCNMLVAIKPTGELSKSRCRIWECRCDCGKTHYITTNTFLSGKQKSCGCAIKTKTTYIKHGHAKKIGTTSTYSSWSNMKRRCLDKSNERYIIYGARGISVCSRWLSFNNFLEDMGEKPQGMTLERINVNGNYEKSNCIWASPKQQANNKRNNHYITFNNITMTSSEWAEKLNISYSALRQRIYRKWSYHRILSQPVRIR